MQRSATYRCQVSKNYMKSRCAGIILFLLVFVSCKKSDIADGTPSCIYKEIAANKINSHWGVASVEEYLFQNKLVYVFNPGTDIADAPSIIKDDNCNTICNVGGYGIPPVSMCNGDIFYQVATLKRTIWKKK